MAESTAWRGPLAGVRVLDLGHYYAAPMVGMLLADQGAEVVRVMKPGDPELPAAQHRLLNRNKRLLTLDLGTEAGRQRARSLAARADVVVESYRPGVMARHGLDHAALAKENPGLVTLSLPGFASCDTERSQIQAWEGVVSAAASLYTTELRQRLDFPPLYIPAPICSAFASMHGAIAVMAALIARQRGMAGTKIEVPLVNAGISTCSRSFVYDGARLRADSMQPVELPAFLAALALEPEDDDESRRSKLGGFAKLAPPIFTTHHYPTSDGRRLMVMPIKPEMASRFFSILGLDTQLKVEGFVVESPWERVDLGHGNNLASSWTLSSERTLRVIELVEEAIARKPADHWQTVFAEAGIPVGYLRTRDEWLSTESLFDAGLLTRMNDGETELTVPGPVADVTGPDGQRLDVTMREPAPILETEIDDVFQTASTPRGVPDGAEVPRRKSQLLADLKVLDLCNVVAGPNAAYTLAQFGADVIRVEPPKSFNLPMHLEWTLEVNQGKRSTILDLSTVPGREAFSRLVRWADIVVHNRLDAVAERLGMTPAALQAINPDVVVCRNTAFGGVDPSAWDAVPGYDPMPNLTTGLDAVAGAPDAPRGMTEIFADLMGGLGTAFAGTLALYQRARTGHAGAGHSSLARGAHHYQLPFLIAEDGSARMEGGAGPDARGESWWQRMYACRDGWIYVGVRAEDRERLSRCVAGENDADEAVLELAFAEKDLSHWIQLLGAEGIGCHRVVSLGELCETARSVGNDAADERAEGALEVLRWDEHPSGLPILLPAPAWVQVGEERSYRRLAPTPKVGEHTREVLRELGYHEQEIERLYALRVAHDFLPAIGSSASYFHHPEKPGDT